jgi:DNA polymerase alpha subunit B
VPFSKLTYYQVVESVLVVNPGFLSKRRAAGTFAKLTIHPPTLTDSERTANQMVPHRLYERARVDIVKI